MLIVRFAPYLLLHAQLNRLRTAADIKLDYGCDTNPFAPASIADECHARANRTFSDVVGIRYAVQYNSTTLRWRGRSLATTFFVQIPMIKAIDVAIFELFGGSVNVSSYDVATRRFPKPEISSFNAVSTASPFLFFAALMFNFVIQVRTRLVWSAPKF